MAASHRVRALAAILLLASLGEQSYAGARAAADHAVQYGLTNGGEILQSFSINPPNGFASIAFPELNFAHATSSRCANPVWSLPDGTHDWTWAGTCEARNAHLILRRSFIVPAGRALTARLSFAIHGGGTLYLNGAPVADSDGQVVLTDVTDELRLNGAKNVLAIDANQTSPGSAGVAYNLQVSLSASAVSTFHRAYPRVPLRLAPPVILVRSGPQVSGGFACNSALQTTVPIFSRAADGSQQITTGWIRQATTRTIYLSTRAINQSAINVPNDMPSAQIQGQQVRADTLAVDNPSGVEVLTIPINTQLNAVSIVSVGNPHNQPVGEIAQVDVFSRSHGCVGAYNAQVIQYLPDSRVIRIAQLDTVPYGDGAEGAPAFDATGNYVGSILFKPSIIDPAGRVTPLLDPPTEEISATDTLITVLKAQQPAASSQQVFVVVNNADGSQSISHSVGSPAPAASGTPAVPSGTPAPAGSPAPGTPGIPTPAASGTPFVPTSPTAGASPPAAGSPTARAAPVSTAPPAATAAPAATVKK